MFETPYPVAVAEPAPIPARGLPDGLLAARVAGAAAADREAEHELCRRFAPRIRLYGLRHLRDESAAGDLVQEVLVDVLERLRAGALREPDRLASFVLGACRLSVSSGRRGAARRGVLLERFGSDLAPAEAERPRLDQERLERCLDGLAPRERAVLQLTFYADRTGEEIAAELELSAGNVRVVRHRALAHLRDCMGAREATP
jgi:RNA polymerase sigma-70 factor (ECF subfamily)